MSKATEAAPIVAQSGHWFVLAAAVLWGTTGTAQALAPAGAPPLAVGAVRLAIGGSALLAVAWLRGAFVPGRPWPRLATLFGAGSMAAYQVFFFAAVARTGVAVGTMVVIGSAPIIAGFIGLLMGQRPSRLWIVSTFLAIWGCGLLIFAGGGVSVDAEGVLLALGAGAASAVSAIASKGVVIHQPPDAAMAVIFSLGALLLAPLLFTTDLDWLAEPRGLFAALHLGLVATMAAYMLFARGLMTVTAATAVTLALAEPLTAALLGVFLLGETLTAVAGAGMALIFCGLALLSVRRPA